MSLSRDCIEASGYSGRFDIAIVFSVESTKDDPDVQTR